MGVPEAFMGHGFILVVVLIPAGGAELEHVSAFESCKECVSVGEQWVDAALSDARGEETRAVLSAWYYCQEVRGAKRQTVADAERFRPDRIRLIVLFFIHSNHG
jgi:hypothetical protein